MFVKGNYCSNLQEDIKQRLLLIGYNVPIFSEGEFEQDSYLAPYACAEMGFMYLDNADHANGKSYLEMAKYVKLNNCSL